MSVHAGLNIRTWFQYMENIARMLTSIGHDPDNDVIRFARTQYDEAAGITRTGIKEGPALFVDHYTSQLIDAKSNNLVMQRTLAFAVMMPLPAKRDYDATIDLKLECETVALQVVSRMYKDRLGNVPAAKKFINVILDDLEGNFIEGPSMVGFEVTIPVQNKEGRLIYDPGLWDDDAAAPILQDLTGMSCANLNDELLGLTTTQRTNCLYVTILESDGTTERTRVAAGGSYTLPESEDMPYIIETYATKADALADNTTEVPEGQAIVVAGRLYQGTGSTAAVLVAAGVFNPSTTEPGDGNLLTVVDDTVVKIQINR